MFKQTLILLVLLSLSLAACSAGAAPMPADYDQARSLSSGGEGYAEPPASTSPEEAQKAADAAFYAAGNTVATVTIDRLVIKNANLSLVVKDPDASLKAISDLATSLGGYVVTSNTYQASVDVNGTKIMRGNISLRVPADKLDAVLAQLEAMAVTGKAESKNISGEDVTAQYTDLESQLTNLQAAEAQLQKIMDGATKTEDVLSVYNQLVNIRGQIEMVKGQMKYYRESAAMSLVQVDLIPDALSQPLVVAGWKPEGVAKEALEALVRAMQDIATALIWSGVYCLPLGLLGGLPLFFIGRAAWRRIRKPQPAKAA